MTQPGRTIGRLAREAGVRVETVRYYQQRGLLKAPSRTGGWRRYDDEALRVLRFVKNAQRLGFSLDEIRDLLALRKTRSVRACRRVFSALDAKLAHIDTKIRDLENVREKLRSLATACRREDPSGGLCRVLTDLEGNAEAAEQPVSAAVGLDRGGRARQAGE